MSHSLLVYIDENSKFNRSEVIQAISSIEGTYDISITQENSADEKKFGYVLFCNYSKGIEIITVRLDIDLECIFVKGFSRAALNFALDLQQKLNVSLKTTDCDYSFLAELDKIESIEELETIVAQRIYMDNK